MTAMTSDSLQVLRHKGALTFFGTPYAMPPNRTDARWPEAILSTVALWLFILLIFLPVIYDRHGGDLSSIALDAVTIAGSMTYALALFWLFRKTLDWPPGARAMMLAAAVIFCGVGNRVTDILWTGFVGDNIQASWAAMPHTIERSYAAILNYILAFSVNLGFFQLGFNRRRELRQERQLVDARSAAQQAQLAALRYQLNPHFLFNTLNSISALIVTRRNDDAEQMTDKLSSFLRASLATDPSQLVPLEEELSLIEEYLDIEGVRFGERLDVTIDCQASACGALVPGFLIQPLVENAIKHGVAPSREPVHIQIEAGISDGVLCITVANDSVPARKKAPSARKGVGLDNVRQRLEAVYGRKASLTTGRTDVGYVARICIPETIAATSETPPLH